MLLGYCETFKATVKIDSGQKKNILQQHNTSNSTYDI